MSSAFQKLLSTKVVEVYKEACKNYGNKTVACNLCVDSCSQEAISLQNQIPVIVDTKCIDCGACISECPVSAIDHLYKPYRKIAQYVCDYPLAEITCDQVEEINKGIKVPCLLYLDTPLLSHYAEDSEEINIYTGHCHSCKKGTSESIFGHFDKLQRQLVNLGVPLRINTKNQLPDNKSQQTVNAVSRRELLRKFSLTSIREFFFPTKSEVQPMIDEKKYEGPSIADRMQMKKRLLNKVGDCINEKKHESETSFFSFVVNDNCNGCNVCESICPTRAVYWETEGNESRLLFNSHLCVECNKCLACPTKALVKNKSLQSSRTKLKVLKSMFVVHCDSCGEIVKAMEDDETTCFFCKAKEGKDSMRFFSN